MAMEEALSPKKTGGRRKRRPIPWVDAPEDISPQLPNHATGYRGRTESVSRSLAPFDNNLRIQAWQTDAALDYYTGFENDCAAPEPGTSDHDLQTSFDPPSRVLESLEHFPFLPGPQHNSISGKDALIRDGNAAHNDTSTFYDPRSRSQKLETDRLIPRVTFRPDLNSIESRNLQRDPSHVSDYDSTFASSAPPYDIGLQEIENLGSASSRPAYAEVNNSLPKKPHTSHWAKEKYGYGRSRLYRSKNWSHTIAGMEDHGALEDLKTSHSGNREMNPLRPRPYLQSGNDMPPSFNTMVTRPGSLTNRDHRFDHRRHSTQGRGSLYYTQSNMYADMSPPSFKKVLNVDSPSFTPATLAVPNKVSSISSQAVNAAPFTPRGMASGVYFLEVFAQG